MTISAVVIADTGSNNLDLLTQSRGEPLFIHAIRRLRQLDRVDLIVLIVLPEQIDAFRSALTKAAMAWVTVIAGNGDLLTSLREASKHLKIDTPEDVVLIHDGARPFTPSELFRAVEEKIREGFSSVVPVLPVTDTIKHVDRHGILTNAVDRAHLRETQTPQGFSSSGFRSLVEDNPADKSDSADIHKLVTHTIPGHPLAIRLETPAELAAAEAMLSTG